MSTGTREPSETVTAVRGGFLCRVIHAVRAMHARTIEITTEGHLTLQGDCIIGVGAAKGARSSSPSMKRALQV